MKAFIKDHWFGILICAMFGFYLIVFAVGIISPQLFEGCTNKLAEDIMSCNKSIWCNAKAFFESFLCEINTVI